MTSPPEWPAGATLTGPPVGAHVGVLFVVLVALGAVSHVDVQARLTKPASPVLVGRDRLEVGGVHARSITAEMVNVQPIGDRAHEKLVGNPVHVAAGAIGQRDAAVPRRVERRSPNPAVAG